MSNLSSNLSETRQSSNRTLLLALGDLVVFSLFVLIGGANHGDSSTDFVRVFAETGVPFIVSWAVVGWLLGVFQLQRFRSMGVAAWRTFLVWLPAGALGLVLRSLILGRVSPLPFAIVALVTLGVMLVLWRALFARFLLK